MNIFCIHPRVLLLFAQIFAFANLHVNPQSSRNYQLSLPESVVTEIAMCELYFPATHCYITLLYKYANLYQQWHTLSIIIFNQ